MGGAALLRLVLYGRVSALMGRGGEDFHSPTLQVEAIRTFLGPLSREVCEPVLDIDQSGRDFQRAGIEQIMRMARAGEIDAVAVYNLSRFGRNTAESLRVIKELRELGVAVVSVVEKFDDTPEGQFMLTQFLSMAQLYSDQIGRGWRQVKARRNDLGMADGQPRFGYELTDGVYSEHPDEGPALIDCYERAIRGESFRGMALRLNSQGLLTRYENPWQSSTLRATLRSGFAAGLVRLGDTWKPGRHPALITDQCWQAFLAARTGAPKRSPQARTHLWSGLLRCAYCHGPLHANSGNYPAGTAWRCARQGATADCPGGGVSAWTPSLNRVIHGWLSELLAGEQDAYEQAVARWRKIPKVNTSPLRKALSKIESDLIVLARKNLDGFYDDPTYLLLRADMLDTQRTLTKQLAEAAPQEPVRHTVRPLLTAWGIALPLEQRHMLTLVLNHVDVHKGPDSPKYRPVPRWVDQE